jgi:hypothetical protein
VTGVVRPSVAPQGRRGAPALVRDGTFQTELDLSVDERSKREHVVDL